MYTDNSIEQMIIGVSVEKFYCSLRRIFTVEKNKSFDKTVCRNAKIDLYKIIFAVMVALYHLSRGFKDEKQLFEYGYIAVKFFFIVSGYLLASSLGSEKYQSVDNTDVLDTSIKYVLKKYRFFLKYNIIVVAVLTLIWAYFEDVSLKDAIISGVKFLPQTFLFYMAGYEGLPWGNALWYLSALILVLFIMTPILIKYHKLYCCYIAPIVSVFLIGYLNVTYKNFNLLYEKNGIFYSGFLRAFAEISLGCVCYAVVKSGILKKYNKYLLFVIEIICILSTVLYAWFAWNKNLDVVVIYIISIGVTMSFGGLQIKMLDNKIISFLGKMSFAVYMTHNIIRFPLSKIKTDFNYSLIVVMYLAMTFTAALLCMAIVRVIDFYFANKRAKLSKH